MVRTSPPTTTLGLLEKPYLLQPSKSWCKPFKKLLRLLRVVDIDIPRSRWSPAELDHSFCFQHTHDLSELSAVFLLVYISSGNEYTICIHLDDIRFDASDSRLGRVFVAKLKKYASRALSRVQDYSDRLIKNGIIHDTSPFADVDLFTCPLCHFCLRTCMDCGTISACSNEDCAGSEVVDFEQCFEHEWVTCHECLDSKELGPDSIFVRCPSCSSWNCCLEVSWCPGRIIHPAPGTEEPVELDPTIALSHPPVPGPCKFCIDSGHVAVWQACSVCRSDLCPPDGYSSDLNYAYCPECITGHEGRRCACGAVWSCDHCPAGVLGAFLPKYPDLISCPRCGATYCRKEDGCQYCHFCQICYQTGPCFGCQAWEKGDVAGEDMLGGCLPHVECLICRIDICNECRSTAKGGVTECSGCLGWMCGECAELSRTNLCQSCS